MTPALALHALTVPFGDAPGLEALSLAVAAGERLALLGPSGEGKTSLLRAIAGLAPVRGGRVVIGDVDVTDLRAESRNAVYLHQVPVLFPHRTVLDNVAFPLEVRGVSRQERYRAVRPLLERLGLETLSARPPQALSGGQRHRVALARALAAKPQVLLLDEPLAALDPVLRADVREAIREAHDASGAALVLVTHDLDDATTLGDRVAVLLDRRLAQVDTPAALFAAPVSLAVQRFLGTHQEVAGVVSASGAIETMLGVLSPGGAASSTPELAQRPPELAPGTPVIVGLRHDAVRCVPASTDKGVGSAIGRVRSLVVRPVGDAAVVQVGDVCITAALGGGGAPRVGDPVRVQLSTHALTVFPA